MLWRMSNAGREAVYAGLSGFLLLGYCSYFLFLGIEFHTPRLLFRAGAGREHHERPVLLQLHHHPDRGIRGYRARKLGGQKCHDSRRAGGQHVFAGGDFLHCEPRRKLFTKIEHFMGKML